MNEENLTAEARVDFDFAVLSLKGRRFTEAEERYSSLVKSTNSSPAWCGLGLAKMSQLYDGRGTVDEIAYCFEKAKDLAPPDQKNQVEVLFGQTATVVIAQFCDAYLKCFEALKTAHRQMFTGTGLTALAALVGSRQSANLFTQLGSAATVAYGISHASDAADVMNAIPMSQASLLKTIEELIDNVKSFGDSRDPIYGQCIAVVSEVEHELHDWQVRIGNTVYRCPDEATLIEWAKNGRVPASASIWNASIGEWKQPLQLPFLRPALDSWKATQSAVTRTTSPTASPQETTAASSSNTATPIEKAPAKPGTPARMVLIGCVSLVVMMTSLWVTLIGVGAIIQAFSPKRSVSSSSSPRQGQSAEVVSDVRKEEIRRRFNDVNLPSALLKSEPENGGETFNVGVRPELWDTFTPAERCYAMSIIVDTGAYGYSTFYLRDRPIAEISGDHVLTCRE